MKGRKEEKGRHGRRKVTMEGRRERERWREKKTESLMGEQVGEQNRQQRRIVEGRQTENREIKIYTFP